MSSTIPGYRQLPSGFWVGDDGSGPYFGDPANQRVVPISSGAQVGVAVPSGPTASGTAGTVVADSSYLYVCTATNTWRRTAIATW